MGSKAYSTAKCWLNGRQTDRQANQRTYIHIYSWMARLRAYFPMQKRIHCSPAADAATRLPVGIKLALLLAFLSYFTAHLQTYQRLYAMHIFGDVQLAAGWLEYRHVTPSPEMVIDFSYREKAKLLHIRLCCSGA